MCKPIIKCSRCEEEFCTGLDYRWHFDKHIDEWWESENKEKYIKETTNIGHETTEKNTNNFWQSIRYRLVGK
jgi:hypothetical protein